MATRVSSYELEIVTGRSEGEDSRAELTLRGEQGRVLANIDFYGPEVTLGYGFVNRASVHLLQLHTDMLSSVLALLHTAKSRYSSMRNA